ncbi:MAG: ATP-binding cassette domain-containing protein [Dehalococcoidia bacterium]
MIEKNSIEINNVSKSFGANPILNDCFLTIKSSERYVLLGSNGSGKTTLAKLLTTLYTPDKGEIIINGYNSDKDSEKIRSLIGYVGHNSLLYGDLSGYDNLRFFCSFYPDIDFKKQFEYLAEILNLSHLTNQKVAKLSHGEKKRLSIMKAMMSNPSVLIMDEPDAGLDANSINNLTENFFPKVINGNITVFLTTHNSDFALSVASTMGILQSGKIESQTQDIQQFSKVIRKYQLINESVL